MCEVAHMFILRVFGFKGEFAECQVRGVVVIALWFWRMTTQESEF